MQFTNKHVQIRVTQIHVYMYIMLWQSMRNATQQTDSNY